MDAANGSDRIEAVRRFNRFYTRRIGVLQDGLLGSELSLTEGRVLYELAHVEPMTASRLGEAVGVDAGYLSRILRGFGARGLIARQQSESDGRQVILSLSEAGRALFDTIDQCARDEVAALLAPLPQPAQDRLIAALDAAAALLGRDAGEKAPVAAILRPPRPGDLGWIVHRHAVLYATEYGWTDAFEAMVAETAARFLRNFDPARERCWIAERDGAIVGSVVVVRQTDELARLRLLYLEPAARGHGIGRRLVEECIHFARQAGYRRMMLTTISALTVARGIYQRAGFTIVASEPDDSFAPGLIGETWERAL
jgi:DNA-binding MarR family transcriptional regulator/GNAT superfamily N-acetyltransferase